jgi:hypothetical protein
VSRMQLPCLSQVWRCSLCSKRRLKHPRAFLLP